MKRSTILRTTVVGATCAVAGAAAGIAGSSASTPTPPNIRAPIRHAWLKLGPGVPVPLPGGAGPPVHSEAIVPNEKGGFDTLTTDRGSFVSLSGQDLTIREGSKTATYKTVTLTIPSGATVHRNGENAQLSDIKSGDTVAVIESVKGSFVEAFDTQHEPNAAMKLRVAPGQAKGQAIEKEGPPPPPDAGGEPPSTDTAPPS